MKSELTNSSIIDMFEKNKNHKRQSLIFAFLVFFILFIIGTNQVESAVLNPTSNFYVNDNAGILSSQTEQYIINTNVELEKKTGAQIVVVTVKSLDNMSIEEYANELFNQWKIGDEEKDNGLLLLCSYGDRQFRVEVGYGLEGKLPDGKTGRMQDEYIIPYLKENKFDEGIKNGYSAFLKEVADEYGVTISGSENATKTSTNVATGRIIQIIMLIIFIIIILARFRGIGGPFIYLGGGGFHGGGSFGGFGGRRRILRWRRTLWWRRKQ